MGTMFTNFLSEIYPDRVWGLPLGGNISDVVWLDDLPPPEDLEQKWSEYPLVVARREAIAKDKAYLASTNYVMSNISEAQVLGQDIQPLLAKYDDVLAEREAARERIRNNQE